MAKEKKVKKDTEKEIEKTEKVDKKETKKFNIKKVCKRLVKKLATACKKLVDKTKDYVRFHKNQVVRTLTSLGILVAVVIIAIIAKNIIVGAGIGNVGYPVIYQKSNNDVYMLEHGASKDKAKEVEKMESTGSVEYANTSDKYVLFKSGQDLYLYNTKKDESTKILENVSYNYGFTPKDSYVFVQNNLGDLYSYDFKEPAQLLDNGITTIQAYSDNSIIYEKDGELKYISFDATKEDKTTLINSYIIADISEDGKTVLYTNSNNVLYRYDVKKDKHTKISNGVEKVYCEDKSCKKIYYIKSEQDTTIEYYNGSKSKTLATDVYDIVGIDLDTKQIVYTELNDDKLSLYYLYKTKKPKKVTTNYDYGSSVVLTKEAIYFINKDSKLIHVKVNGSSVGKEKELSKEVQGTLTKFGDGVYFYKNINDKTDATYYVADGTKVTKIADDIRRGELIPSLNEKNLYYISDMDGKLGTLSVFDGKDSKKIAEGVQSKLYVKGETIYYIANYEDSTKTGTLYRYDGSKKELSSGVSYIVTTTPNEQNND